MKIKYKKVIRILNGESNTINIKKESTVENIIKKIFKKSLAKKVIKNGLIIKKNSKEICALDKDDIIKENDTIVILESKSIPGL